MASVPLLVADATNLALGALLGPQWGIYYKGAPVILPASVFSQIVTGALAPIAAVASAIGLPNILPVAASMVEFEFKQEWPVSNYPQEQGAFQSYNKVTLPFDVRVKLACGGPTAARQAFLQTVFAIAGNQPPGAAGLATALLGSGVPNPASAPLTSSLPLFSVVTPELTYTSVTCVHVGFSRMAEKGATLIVADLWFQEISVTAVAAFQNTKSPANAGPVANGNIQPTTPVLGGGLISAGNVLAGFNPANLI